MTPHDRAQVAAAARLRYTAVAVLGLAVAGFVLGVVLHVSDQAGAGEWMFGSFAGITFGTGLLAVAHRARDHALLHRSSDPVERDEIRRDGSQ
ncbi:hypothetical protein BFL34_01742 [Clavibacter michiganensis]|uniref:Uncharacterized protein n=1 Tax=Clavibacter michiganensis TaxID=28447 RepID=A0A251Y9K0_9MICO|nr:hypothetical protein [Clavibacter michiganensis]OUE20924.1 hypothetical protein BFL34_01742 [Clavibacter michiganensis]